MKRSYFVPESFDPPPDLVEWACETFKVDEAEVNRQLELMRDHEFRRPYSCWTRVFRNWLRKAEEIGSFRRRRKYRDAVELTEEERQRDIQKWKEDMRRLRVVK